MDIETYTPLQGESESRAEGRRASRDLQLRSLARQKETVVFVSKRQPPLTRCRVIEHDRRVDKTLNTVNFIDAHWRAAEY